ncbi:hypothetical protein Trydic_g13139 [Trypoxylus dichotomus]
MITLLWDQRVSRASSPWQKKARIRIEFKKKILEEYESRMHIKSPCMINSTVTKIEATKESNVAKNVNSLSKQRSEIIGNVEQLLIGINQQQLDCYSISDAILSEKARLLYANFIKEVPRAEKFMFEFNDYVDAEEFIS